MANEISPLGINDPGLSTSMIGIPSQMEMQGTGMSTSLRGMPDLKKVTDGFNPTQDMEKEADELLRQQGIDPNQKHQFLNQLANNAGQNHTANTAAGMNLANNIMKDIGNVLKGISGNGKGFGGQGVPSQGSSPTSGTEPQKPGSSQGSNRVEAKKGADGERALQREQDAQNADYAANQNAMKQNQADGAQAGQKQQQALGDKQQIDNQNIPKDQENIAADKQQIGQGEQQIVQGKGQETKGVAEQQQGIAQKQVGQGIKQAGQMLQQIGKTLQQTGKSLQQTGQMQQQSGQQMECQGQALMSNPYTAAAGAALMAAGKALFAAGKGIEAAGKGVENSGKQQEQQGKTQEKQGDQQIKQGEETKKQGDQDVNQGKQVQEQGKQIKDEGKQNLNQHTNDLKQDKIASQQKGQEAQQAAQQKAQHDAAAQQRAGDLNAIRENMDKINEAIQKLQKGLAGKGGDNDKGSGGKGGGLPQFPGQVGLQAKTSEQLKKEMEAMGIKDPKKLQEEMNRNRFNQGQNQGQLNQPANLQNMAQRAAMGDFSAANLNQQSQQTATPQVQAPQASKPMEAAPQVQNSQAMAPEQTGKQTRGTLQTDGLLAGTPFGKQGSAMGQLPKQRTGLGDEMGQRLGHDLNEGVSGDGIGEAGAMQQQLNMKAGNASVEENDDGVVVNLNQVVQDSTIFTGVSSAVRGINGGTGIAGTDGYDNSLLDQGVDGPGKKKLGQGLAGKGIGTMGAITNLLGSFINGA